MSTTKDPQQKKAPVIQNNQEVLHDNLSGYVRKNLEGVLNELLDAEADRLCPFPMSWSTFRSRRCRDSCFLS